MIGRNYQRATLPGFTLTLQRSHVFGAVVFFAFLKALEGRPDLIAGTVQVGCYSLAVLLRSVPTV